MHNHKYRSNHQITHDIMKKDFDFNPMDDLDETVEDNDAYEVNLTEDTYYEPEKNIKVAILGSIAILFFCIGVIWWVS